MTGDFDRLRGAMTELAEHGGDTDLYERSRHASRRMRRRRGFATLGGAAAAVVVAIGAGVALSGDGPRTDSPPIAVPTTAPPSPSAAPSPAITRPSLSAPPPSTRPATSKPSGGCPVTAATLDRVPGLPDGYRITPSTVRCWKGWATGWQRDQTGDGMYVFRYTPGTGWRLRGQGSAISCESLGIRVDPKDPPPFCS